jgi:hypothetical protein
MWAVTGILAEFPECRRAVHSGHHHVQKNSVGLMLNSSKQALRAGIGCHNVPASHGFKAERGNFANIVFIVNDQYAVGHGRKSSVQQNSG